MFAKFLVMTILVMDARSKATSSFTAFKDPLLVSNFFFRGYKTIVRNKYLNFYRFLR